MPERHLDKARSLVADAERGVSEMQTMPGHVNALKDGIEGASSGLADLGTIQVPKVVVTSLKTVLDSLDAFVKFVDAIAKVCSI